MVDEQHVEEVDQATIIQSQKFAVINVRRMVVEKPDETFYVGGAYRLTDDRGECLLPGFH